MKPLIDWYMISYNIDRASHFIFTYSDLVSRSHFCGLKETLADQYAPKRYFAWLVL